MLACIQRRQNFSSQRLTCTPKSLNVPPPPLLVPAAPQQPCSQTGEPASVTSRYPSPAELDAFAQKTANSPLSIKIFQSDVRVPQHKQLNKTVNGLDTTGQRYSPYLQPHSRGYQGLLAVVKASVVVKGVVKTCEGRKTKHANSQTSVTPYNNPQTNGYAVRHGHKAYHISSCKPSDVPNETLCSTAGMASRDQSLPPQSELAEVQSLMRKMSRVPHSQALQLGGEAGVSPSLRAAAAVARSDSDFALGVPPQSSLAFAGTVPPAQGSDMAKCRYVEGRDYRMWQQKAQMQQPYQHRAVRMYRAADGESPETCLPPPSSSQLPYRWHHGNGGLSCASAQEEQAAGQYYAPLWDDHNSDCYTSQVLPTCSARPTDMELQHQIHQHPPLPHAYSADQNLCCGLPSFSLCHAAALSSSLQSLECLISEIHPPCIKERMLGHGYEAIGMPQLLDHQQQNHIQLPVYR